MRLFRLVVVESPYAGDVERNLEYVRACMRDCLTRGEAPFASHALYTQPGVLDDLNPIERKLGIEAGFAWGAHAHCQAFYVDRGWSKGMRQAWHRAQDPDRRGTFEIRRVPGWSAEGLASGCSYTPDAGRGVAP